MSEKELIKRIFFELNYVEVIANFNKTYTQGEVLDLMKETIKQAKKDYLKEIIDEYNNATFGCNDLSIFEEWLMEEKKNNFTKRKRRRKMKKIYKVLENNNKERS